MKFRIPIYLHCFLAFLAVPSYGLTPTDSLLILGYDHQRIMEWHEEQFPGEESDAAAAFSSWSALAGHLYEAGEYDRAIAAQQYCLNAGARLKTTESDAYRDAVNDMALFLLRNQQAKAAERFIRKHIDRQVDDWRYIKLCFFYAESLETLGDLTLAGKYLERAMHSAKEIGDLRYQSRAMVRLSRLYVLSANAEGALNILDLLGERNDWADDYKRVIQFNISKVYIDAGKFEPAVVILDDILAWSTANDADAYTMQCLNSKGYVLRELGRLEEAMAVLRAAEKYEEIHALVYNNMAEVYLLRSMPDSAVLYAEKSLRAIGFDLDDAEAAGKALQYPFKEELIIFFHDLARYLTAQGQSGSTSALGEAARTYQLLDEVVSGMRATTTELQSQHFWRQEVKPIYDDALAVAYLLQDMDMAFYFSEQSKAVLLLDDLARNAAVAKGILPDSLLDKEIRLKRSIYQLEVQMLSGRSDSLVDLLLAEKRKLQDVRLSMQAISPQYGHSQNAPAFASLAAFQKTLSGNHRAVSYSMGEQFLYRLSISRKEAALHRVAMTPEFKKMLKSYIDGLKRPYGKKDLMYQANEMAILLYETLLGGIAWPADGRLSIFPDGALAFLPFEALVVNNDPKAPEYLLEKQVVQYGFSIQTTYLEQAAHEKWMENLAFAPIDYDASLELTSLRYSAFELAPLLSMGKTLLLENEEATKTGLLNALSGKRIVHLYSHAAANDPRQPFPYIAARDSLIFLPEIYNARIPADLVLLSACETSLGEEVAGEGVISLARGFFHAGAHSVLASLWTVNDKSNAEIIHYFYEYSAKGYSNAEALRRSKLRYMESFRLEAQSPYYWAGVVYIGEDAELNATPKMHGNQRWAFPISAVLLFMLGWYWWRRRQAP